MGGFHDVNFRYGVDGVANGGLCVVLGFEQQAVSVDYHSSSLLTEYLARESSRVALARMGQGRTAGGLGGLLADVEQ